MESCQVIDGFIILLEKLYFVNKKTNAIFYFLRCQFCHSCRFNSLRLTLPEMVTGKSLTKLIFLGRLYLF